MLNSMNSLYILYIFGSDREGGGGMGKISEENKEVQTSYYIISHQDENTA